jgi:hypothetical protein
MKISEMIEELQKILNKEGNIPVVNYNFEDNLILTVYQKDDFYDTMLIIE